MESNNQNRTEMKEVPQDILQDPTLRENPFSVPPQYFDGIEDRIRARIRGTRPEPEGADGILSPAAFAPRPSRPVFFKTHFALAAMFVFIFGMGYGFLRLTETFRSAPRDAALADAARIQDSLLQEELWIAALESAPLDESEMLAVMETSTPEIDTETIEQYLIDSGLSLVSLALAETE